MFSMEFCKDNHIQVFYRGAKVLTLFWQLVLSYLQVLMVNFYEVIQIIGKLRK